MRFNLAVLSGILILGSLAPRNLAAIDMAEVEKELARVIVPVDVPLQELQVFIEARIPKMPEVDSAEAWQAEADRLRQRVLDEVVFRGEAAAWRKANTEIRWFDTIEGGPGYRIRKLTYEALPGLWVPALLYEPTELEGKRPVVLNVNGHDGAGKAAPYKQLRCINLAKRGMLALNVEWLGMGQLSATDNGHYRMNQLDLCGTSGLAPFYLSMTRAMDVLLSHPNADPARVAMAGLSGGGWQTIIVSSLDPRVTLANPVAGYSSYFTRARHFQDLGDSEQTPSDLATVVDYTHLTAMLAPRAALLTYNSKDQCCFQSSYALPPLLAAAEPIYRLFGKADRLRSHVNDDPGTHNFERENREALYAMIGDQFYAGEEFDAVEIDSEAEVKTADELSVPLPGDNLSLHGLAEGLRQGLPRAAQPPTNAAAGDAWRGQQRQRLAELVRARQYTCEATEITRDPDEAQSPSLKENEITVVHWKLKLADDWTLPAAEFAPPQPQGTTLILGDAGRKQLAAQVSQRLAAGDRVIAVDPFYFGESQIVQRDFLFALLVACVGQRPLGIQASQLRAVAEWLRQRDGGNAVTIESVGARTSVIATVAAALPGDAIGKVNAHDALASLHEVIERNHGVNEMPELFCFGLLESFDLPQLRSLSER